jgi:hypothetical protein
MQMFEECWLDEPDEVTNVAEKQKFESAWELGMGHVFQLVFNLAPVGTGPNHLLEALVHILALLCCDAG